MATRRWIRLDADWDTSDWLIDLQPGGRLAWIELMCYVKRSGKEGRVKAMTPRAASRLWRIAEDDVIEMLEDATEDGALALDDGDWVLANWRKYQEVDATTKERSRRYRESKSRLSTSQRITRDNRDEPCQDRDDCHVTTDSDIDRDRGSSTPQDSGEVKPPQLPQDLPRGGASNELAIAEMREAVDRTLPKAPPQRLRSFEAAAGPIVEGLSTATWAGPDGTGVPWSDRPRLLALALAKCVADAQWGSNALHSALRYVIPQQLDPHPAPKSNGPRPGSEAAAVCNESPGAGRSGSRAGPVRVDGHDPEKEKREGEQRELKAIAEWAQQHPDEAKQVRAEVETEVATDNRWRGMPVSIVQRAAEGLYRERVFERMQRNEAA